MTKFLSLAKKKASQSTQHYKHCCIIFKGGSIIGIGVNNDKMHAEEMAIHGISDEKLNRAKFLSIRITGKDTLAMAKPCEECAMLLASYKMTGWYSITTSIYHNLAALEFWRC